MEEERYHEEERPCSNWVRLKGMARLVGYAVVDIILEPKLLCQLNWFENRWK